MRIPILFEIKNKTVIAVGGGAIAAKKIKPLFEAGADITLIAPEIHPDLQALYENGEIKWKERMVQEREQFDSSILLLMTEKAELNQSLYENKRPDQLVYIINDAKKSDFHFPAVLKKGQLTIALSTNGASPIYAKRLKKQLEEHLPVEVEEDLAFLDQARKSILAYPLTAKQKKQLLQQITTEDFLRRENRQQLFEAMLEEAEE
ncbi:precorrin-2 dehydrogenase/sirohydrochlorin ferrochelatase family protein [Oceanobacillus locisalsi]|uniref:precorrin-2 dehydrogenase n=1 Tax=Oceanobacillus locisalsi TaxID=546107 RepID=A0ABW3NIW5_9BACI